jgi:hypothetical protein
LHDGILEELAGLVEDMLSELLVMAGVPSVG